MKILVVILTITIAIVLSTIGLVNLTQDYERMQAERALEAQCLSYLISIGVPRKDIDVGNGVCIIARGKYAE